MDRPGLDRPGYNRSPRPPAEPLAAVNVGNTVHHSDFLNDDMMTRQV